MANRSPKSEFPRLVVDANIMISALLGRSFPLLVRMIEEGVLLFAAVRQLVETRKRIEHISGLPPSWADEQMTRLDAVIIPLHPVLLEKHEIAARSRLSKHGQPDWTVLAACYEARAAAWSHDKDLFGSGIAVWSTAVLSRELGNKEVSNA